MWEYPSEVETRGDSAAASDQRATVVVDVDADDDAGRLYEDPDYLQQHSVYWDDGGVSGRTVTAEDEAYLSAENAAYLRKVSAVRSLYTHAATLVDRSVASVNLCACLSV